MIVRLVHADTAESIAFDFQFEFPQATVTLSDIAWSRVSELIEQLKSAGHQLPIFAHEASSESSVGESEATSAA